MKSVEEKWKGQVALSDGSIFENPPLLGLPGWGQAFSKYLGQKLFTKGELVYVTDGGKVTDDPTGIPTLTRWTDHRPAPATRPREGWEVIDLDAELVTVRVPVADVHAPSSSSFAVHRLTVRQHCLCLELFDQMDTNDDGNISLTEIEIFIDHLGKLLGKNTPEAFVLERFCESLKVGGSQNQTQFESQASRRRQSGGVALSHLAAAAAAKVMNHTLVKRKKLPVHTFVQMCTEFKELPELLNIIRNAASNSMHMTSPRNNARRRSQTASVLNSTLDDDEERFQILKLTSEESALSLRAGDLVVQEDARGEEDFNGEEEESSETNQGAHGVVKFSALSHSVKKKYLGQLVLCEIIVTVKVNKGRFNASPIKVFQASLFKTKHVRNEVENGDANRDDDANFKVVLLAGDDDGDANGANCDPLVKFRGRVVPVMWLSRSQNSSNIGFSHRIVDVKSDNIGSTVKLSNGWTFKNPHANHITEEDDERENERILRNESCVDPKELQVKTVLSGIAFSFVNPDPDTFTGTFSNTFAGNTSWVDIYFQSGLSKKVFDWLLFVLFVLSLYESVYASGILYENVVGVCYAVFLSGALGFLGAAWILEYDMLSRHPDHGQPDEWVLVTWPWNFRSRAAAWCQCGGVSLCFLATVVACFFLATVSTETQTASHLRFEFFRPNDETQTCLSCALVGRLCMFAMIIFIPILSECVEIYQVYCHVGREIQSLEHRTGTDDGLHGKNKCGRLFALCIGIAFFVSAGVSWQKPGSQASFATANFVVVGGLATLFAFSGVKTVVSRLDRLYLALSRHLGEGWNMLDCGILGFCVFLCCSGYIYIFSADGLDFLQSCSTCAMSANRSNTHEIPQLCISTSELGLEKIIEFWAVRWHFKTLFAALGCVVTLWAFKYLAAIDPRLAVVPHTLFNSGKGMASFLWSLLIVFMSFAVLFRTWCGSQMETFSTWLGTFIVLVRALLGDFSFDEIVGVSYVWGFLYMALFIVLIVFGLLTVLVAVLDQAYTQSVDASEAAVRVQPHFVTPSGLIEALATWRTRDQKRRHRAINVRISHSSGERFHPDSEPAFRSTAPMYKTQTHRILHQELKHRSTYGMITLAKDRMEALDPAVNLEVGSFVYVDKEGFVRHRLGAARQRAIWSDNMKAPDTKKGWKILHKRKVGDGRKEEITLHCPIAIWEDDADLSDRLYCLCCAAFSKMDSDHDGKVTKNELDEFWSTHKANMEMEDVKAFQSTLSQQAEFSRADFIASFRLKRNAYKTQMNVEDEKWLSAKSVGQTLKLEAASSPVDKERPRLARTLSVGGTKQFFQKVDWITPPSDDAIAASSNSGIKIKSVKDNVVVLETGSDEPQQFGNFINPTLCSDQFVNGEFAEIYIKRYLDVHEYQVLEGLKTDHVYTKGDMLFQDTQSLDDKPRRVSGKVCYTCSPGSSVITVEVLSSDAVFQSNKMVNRDDSSKSGKRATALGRPSMVQNGSAFTFLNPMVSHRLDMVELLRLDDSMRHASYMPADEYEDANNEELQEELQRRHLRAREFKSLHGGKPEVYRKEALDLLQSSDECEDREVHWSTEHMSRVISTIFSDDFTFPEDEEKLAEAAKAQSQPVEEEQTQSGRANLRRAGNVTIAAIAGYRLAHPSVYMNSKAKRFDFWHSKVDSPNGIAQVSTKDAVEFLRTHSSTKDAVGRIQREQGDTEHEKMPRAEMCRLFCIASANEDRVELVELSRCQQIFFQLFEERMELDADVIEHHFNSMDESTADCKSLGVVVRQIAALESKVDKLNQASFSPSEMPVQQQQQKPGAPRVDVTAIVDAAAIKRLRQVEETYADAVATARRDLLSCSGLGDISSPPNSPALASTAGALSTQVGTLQTKVDRMESSLNEILALLKSK